MGRKKSKVGFWVIMVISLVIIIGGAIFLFVDVDDIGCDVIAKTNAKYELDPRLDEEFSGEWFQDCVVEEFDGVACEAFDLESPCLIPRGGCWAAYDTDGDGELNYFEIGTIIVDETPFSNTPVATTDDGINFYHDGILQVCGPKCRSLQSAIDIQSGGQKICAS